MVFQSKTTCWKKIIRNAAVLGAIAAVSNLATSGDLSLSALYTGILAGILIALVEIKNAYKIIASPAPNGKKYTPVFLS